MAKNWELLSEDIQRRQRRIFNFQALELNSAQIKSLLLAEIEQLLTKGGKSLNDFPGMPLPDSSVLQDLNNRLVNEELNYDKDSLRIEHMKLLHKLNQDQTMALTL